MKIDESIRKTIKEQILANKAITVDEVVKLIDVSAEEPDIEKLVANDKKNKARHMLASFRDKNNVRIYYGLRDQDRTFVNVEKCDAYAKLALVENQLRVMRNGLNRSLGKVTCLKNAFGKCVALNGERSAEATALANKLYAMADELQSMLTMKKAA